LVKLFNTYIKNNLGLINLFGKVSGRVLFLLLTSFFAYKLSFKTFAAFAIFWTALRMLTFFSANNLYIICFNEVRESLLNKMEWPVIVSANIVVTFIIFGLISTLISFLIFKNLTITLLVLPTLFFFVIIRDISEFSKSDNSVYLSIFIEDFLFYVLFFITGIISIYLFDSLEGIVLALFLSTLITAIIALILFKRKFKLSIKKYSFNLNDFSLNSFRLGINYTFLRGNDFLSNFGVRYLGQIYFGDVFVSYAHIMYQFYNIFTLITISVISGLQSEITVTKLSSFNKDFIRKTYRELLKTITPFIFGTLIIIILFNTQILSFIFPKYVEYNELLIKVSLTSLLFMLIQPLVFIMIYNNKMANLKTLNVLQYIAITIVYVVPYFFSNFNEEYWLLLVMTIFIVIQGLFSIQNYKRI
jgi:hypothetical protein